MKNWGIFTKIFFYMILSVLLLVGVTAVLFSQQFMSFYRTTQTQKITASYQPLVMRIQRNNRGGMTIAETAQRFYENNQSFEFLITDKDGATMYTTPNAETPDSFDGDFYYVVHKDENLSIIAQSKTGLEEFYRELIIRGAAAFFVMLVLCFVCSFVFARQMTRPIKSLVDNTSRMANLEEVAQASERKDELGILARDVYSMYAKLKETISKLEDEILRVREMEETQRYFFSAASHELKTPIAATSVLLEGMIENIGDYRNHPKYLRECMKLMDTQSKVISEILEIVSFNSGNILPVPEPLDLRHMIVNMLPDFQILSESGNQHIFLDIPDGQTCLADPNMLQKALSNILLNAVQNTPQGGEIRIWSEHLSQQYHLCILNTGARIDKAVLPKLFDPFYRTDKARSRKNGNNGLGLTIVQNMLESMKLNFSLENTRDGVLFWIDLPDVHSETYPENRTKIPAGNG